MMFDMKNNIKVRIGNFGKKIFKIFDKINIEILFFTPIILSFFIPPIIKLFQYLFFNTIPQQIIILLISKLILFFWGLSGWAIIFKEETPSVKYFPHQKKYAMVIGIALIVIFWGVAFIY